MKYKEIFNKLNFKSMTEVQQKINEIKGGKNILVVSSCGSGKTEGSYFKMLEYGEKTIIAEPMKTLANSISDRLGFYNNQLNLENVTLQHSSSQQDRFLKNKYSVTTIDQILSGYLAIGKQAYMKGKNVIMSNIIFDEVQLFDTDTMLLTTINMLDELYKLSRKFIIMTATMPRFLIDFLQERYNMEVIIAEDIRDDRKVQLFYIEKLNYENIIKYEYKQIIICNSIKQLYKVYDNLPKDRVIILHSKFLNSNRLELEKEVNNYFGKNSNENNKILLTTQIVEVGIDISCSRLYTTACSIDSLVQRDGRCCRWGGIGQVIVFKNNDNIYDEYLVTNTIRYIQDNQGIDFNWNIQKQWIDEILNDYYKERITKFNIEKNKQNFKGCNKSKLIRDIQSVNIVVCNNTDKLTKEDFCRESISIQINELKKISETNELYILNKSTIEKISYGKAEIGDTILIQGNNCIYDKLGFRYIEDYFLNEPCPSFPKLVKSVENFFNDYVEETWLHHATQSRNVFEGKLIEEHFNEYIVNNIKKISFFGGGLHDLGKLDIEWLKKYPSTIPMAHFPFVRGFKGERRTHEFISGEILKEFINDKIIYNMIIQHHKRLYVDIDIEYRVSDWNLHKDTNKILEQYGFKQNIKLSGKAKSLKRKDIITPSDDNWTTLLYLVGTFMECEIQAINEYINNYKQVG